ncbi:MAG: 50S ribosomal protein L24 [Candidatus Berkelbacteria bacterium]|nr:50S ribosomal protein L24 [Candidatus Berkelbacteria bacterium]
MKLKKNDNVLVIGGRDKGKSGVIERVFPKDSRIVVKGIAIAKKHVKPSRKSPQGGIIDINLKITVSNVMIICPSCGKPTKIAYKGTNNDKNKLRICKKCGQSLEGGIK